MSTNEGFGGFKQDKVEGANVFAGSEGATKQEALENLNKEFARNLKQELTMSDEGNGLEFIKTENGYQAKINLRAFQYENQELEPNPNTEV